MDRIAIFKENSPQILLNQTSQAEKEYFLQLFFANNEIVSLRLPKQ